MAIATSTAIAVSAAVSLASAGGSFIQAGKERKRQEQADRDAKKAFNESKATLDTLYAQERSVQKEKYQIESDKGIEGLSSLLALGQSGERGVGELAGRANVYNQNQQARVRSAMGQEMTDIQNKEIAEKQAVRNAQVNIGLQEAQGQQMIAADARAARTAANQAGVQGLVSAGTTAMKIPGLYGSSGGVNVDALEVGGSDFTNAFGSVSSTPDMDFDFTQSLPNANSVQVEEYFDPIFVPAYNPPTGN
tara:strand:- start:60 stop:806 length:747 start_codon:yes stop_codon:yes gene_type:complete